MKRVAIMLATAVVLVCGAGVAQAQTAATAADKSYVELTGGLTFAKKTSGSVGAEGAWFFTDSLGIFAEGGRMQNVPTSALQDGANLIAGAIGASATAKRHISYFDAGVTYRLPMGSPRVRPYALFGIGAAHVTNATTFSVNGSDITGQLESLGVSLGTDLAGSYTKAFVTLGGGVHIPIRSRWFGDVSYRYGWVAKNTDAEINALNTNRFQFGFGATF